MTPADDAFDDLIDAALAHQRNGALEQAEAIYRDILEHKPGHAEVLHLLGLVLHQRGAHAAAADMISQAVSARPEVIPFRFNLGLVQTAAGHFQNAADTFSLILKRDASDPQVGNAYAIALKGAGQWDAAETAFEDLARRHPGFAGGHYNLGNLRAARGRPTAAIAAFERAVALAPGDAGIVRNLAAALQSIGETSRAVTLLEALQKAAPNDAATLNNLGNLYRQTGDPVRAHDTLAQAASADPLSADVAYNLGTVRADMNDTTGAIAEMTRAGALRPGFVKADWAAALALPQIYASADERLQTRARWLDGLERISAAPLPTGSSEIAAHLAAIAEITPFGLAYQGENDLAPMCLWGDHVSAIARRAFPDLAEPPVSPARTRKRIGFVSAHFRAHTVERLFSGWLSNLDREAFDVHLISTSGPGDARTAELAAGVDAAHTTPMGLAELARHIHGLAADILVYPDIGMDPRTQVLAALPLAPKQAMSWGHPVSSGLPDIDVFLSSALMEPDDGESHYREALVRLPGLSISYQRPRRPEGALPHHALLCAQSLFKIPPHQDRVFAAIIAACPDARLSFFAHPIAAVTAAFRNRLAGAFRAAGLDPERTLDFIAPCSREVFLRHLAGTDVIVDTFEWSGGNTSLEAIAMGTPVVTLPGRFMRGRHTSAMLEMMEITQLCAADAEDFTAIAIDLLRRPNDCAALKSLIAERAQRLFDDTAPGVALNGFLQRF